MKKILVLNGPNLNLLGKRDARQYGVLTLPAIEQQITDLAKEMRMEVDFFQSNHEGELIDRIHEAMETHHGMLINPGAFTHYSYAIRDAIEATGIPTIEVHLSNIHGRESFRSTSVIAPICVGQVCGLKEASYTAALFALNAYLSGSSQLAT